MRQIQPRVFFYSSSSVICIVRLAFVAAVLLSASCTHLLFQPIRPHLYFPDDFGVDYDDIVALTDDGVHLHGWVMRAAGERTGSLIFFHGNGENLSTHFLNVHWLTELGYEVTLFDYRGYGASEGEPQLDAIVADYDVMLGAVLSALPHNEKLIVMGHSFGASLSIYGIAHSRYKQRIAALITVAAFADYHDITQELLSRSWLTWALQWPLSFTIDNSYRPLDSVEQISPVPLLIMHSADDEIIDLHHAQDLYASANPPRQLVVLEGDHNQAFNFESGRKLLLDYFKAQGL